MAKDYISIDFGTGGTRMGWFNKNDKYCTQIGNYPGAQAGTPSLVLQAPSDIVYKRNGEGTAIPVAFGYTRPRKGLGEILVSKVKLALLPHSGDYDYAQNSLKDASDTLKLGSTQQITEDFLKFAIEHATKECGGQPMEGWVVSVPQSYGIDEVQSFRSMIQRAGGLGDIFILGESDCVAYAHLTSIEENISKVKKEAFRKRQNLTVAVGVIDLGAGTADVTTSEICFKRDGTAPTINELRAPLGFAIGGDLFDNRFVEVLRAKLGIQLSTEAEKVIFEPFVDYFHRCSKPQWSLDNNEDDEYPFLVPEGAPRFVLTVEDMAYIMKPPINETCRRISNHLGELKHSLQLVVVSGGNSEVAGMMPLMRVMLKTMNIVSADEQIIHLVGQSSNAVVRGLHFWMTNPDLVGGKYARITLAREVQRPRKHLASGTELLEQDIIDADFFNCAEMIMKEGEFVPEGVRTVAIYFDIDADAETFDASPIVICVPNKDAAEYISGTAIWCFASESRPVGVVDIAPALAGIKVGDLRRVGDGRRFWLRLGVQIGAEITMTASWRLDGRKAKVDTGLHSVTFVLDNLELPDKPFLNDFRAPVQQREGSDSSIREDTLPDHIRRLRTHDQAYTPTPSCARVADQPRVSNVDPGSTLRTNQGSEGYVRLAEVQSGKRSFSDVGEEQDDSSQRYPRNVVQHQQQQTLFDQYQSPYPTSPLLPLPPITGGTPFVNTAHPQIWPASFSHRQMPIWTSPEPGQISSLAQAQHGSHDNDGKRLVDPQRLQQQLSEPWTRAVGTGSKFNVENHFQVPLITTTQQFPGNSEGWSTNNGGMPWSSR